MTDEADAIGVDVGAHAQQLDCGLDIAGSILEGGEQAIAVRSAHAPVVPAQRGDARLREVTGEIGEEPEFPDGHVTVLVAAAVDEDDRRMGTVAVGQGNLASQDECAIGERHFLGAVTLVWVGLCGRARVCAGTVQPEGAPVVELGELALDHPVTQLAVPLDEPKRRLQLKAQACSVQHQRAQRKSDIALDVDGAAEAIVADMQVDRDGQGSQPRHVDSAFPAALDLSRKASEADLDITWPDFGPVSLELVQCARAVASHDAWQTRCQALGPDDPAPQAWVAPIAVGERVIASSRSTDARRVRHPCSDASAVAMEDVGVTRAAELAGIRCLAIRGISDLLDGKETADAAGGQRVAADHAAAFAFELLAELYGR